MIDGVCRKVTFFIKYEDCRLNLLVKCPCSSLVCNIIPFFQKAYFCQKPNPMKIFFLAFFLLIVSFSSAQVVINELDSDTDGVDDLEFIELKTTNPFQPLDGYVLVLFNGSSSGNDSSYFAYDLDGLTTNINGTLVIGSNNVSPVPEVLISINTIQNGADAVAIYSGDDVDFPDGTQATTINLIDALVYGTNDADDTGLMALLGVSVQIDEDQNNNKDFESIQRNNDGTYFVGTPTPGALNDGSGVDLNGVSFSVPQTQYDEGDGFNIVFILEDPVASNFTINFSLDNGTFDSNDFTGNTSVTIPAGSNTATTSISIIDDNLDEGDEELVISMVISDDYFVKLNDNLKIRVVDNDFTVAPFGTPLSPTYGIVQSTAPSGYYNSLDNLSGAVLKQGIQDIIADENVVRAQTYADVVTILMEADENPAHSNQVWLLYTEQGRAKLDYEGFMNEGATWNREHTYPRSRGGFYSIEDDDIADGPTIFWNTNADSLRHGNSDAHALRAADSGENSSRGNKNYGEYNGPAGNQGSFKGDVARSVFYMAVRYNGLDVVSGNPPNNPGQMGNLDSLLVWHRNDPPDDFEMNRNNIIYTWQKNRNPFIDYPDLVEYIWGNQQGQVWDQPMSVNEADFAEIGIYPNPTSGGINITGIMGKCEFSVYSISGKQLFKTRFEGNSSIKLNLASGVYFGKITTESGTATRKIIIR